MRALEGIRLTFVLVCVLTLLCGCQTTAPSSLAAAPPGVPARFLLTFDDGPSARDGFNPTAAILDCLASNPLQPGIKAVFFVQTRARDGGGTPRGRELLARVAGEGHVLAVHSGSPRGHKNHRYLSDVELNGSLADAVADLRGIVGQTPTLVRPPFWAYDARTLAAYRAAGLSMLLTDINARDGKIYGWNISLRRRSHFRSGLSAVRESLRRGALPVVQDVVPVVITFHDLNTFTARHMEEYLRILVEESRRVGLPLATAPFYSSASEVERAALARARNNVYAGTS